MTESLQAGGLVNGGTLATRLKDARTRRRWTQRDLARASRLTRGWVSQVEKGIIRNPYWPTIVACARALDVSAEWLMTGDQTSPETEAS